jgi:hypothetical protein
VWFAAEDCANPIQGTQTLPWTLGSTKATSLEQCMGAAELLQKEQLPSFMQLRKQ